MRLRVPALISSVLMAVIVSTAMVPAAVAAPLPVTVEFDDTTPIAAAFGSDWATSVRVSALGYGTYYGSEEYRPATTTAGTVDVYLSGIGGAFATALPLQSDGRAYISQPTDEPLLPPGTYQMTVVFNPAPGSSLASAQTATAIDLSITAVSMTSSVALIEDASVSVHPVISASVAVDDADGGAKVSAGSWLFTIADESDAAVFSREVAANAGSAQPVQVEVKTALEPGSEYSVSAVFTPAPEFATGYTVTPASPVTLSIPGNSLSDTLLASAPIPLNLAIIVLSVMVFSLAAAIASGTMMVRRRRAAATPAESDDGGMGSLAGDDAPESLVPAGQRTDWTLSGSGDDDEAELR